MDAADWDTAILKLMALKVRRATMPDMTMGTSGGTSQGIRWTPSEIDSLIAQCRQMKGTALAAAGGPFQQTKVLYERPDAVEVY
jgi:hypothetical protein